MLAESLTVQKPRLMMFSHDTFGLGHLRRCSTIAKACARAIGDLSILYVTGATRPHRFGLPACADVVTLPSLTKNGLGGYVPRHLDVSTDLVLSMRRGLVLEAVKRFAPHVLLIDHAPLGASGELKSALTWLRERRPGTRVVLGMRDVIDDPTRVAAEFGGSSLADVVASWFDDVLVYGDRRVFDPVEEYGLSAIADRVTHVGYVTEPPAARAPSGPRPRVLVHAGGAEDGIRLYETVLEALAGPLADLDANIDILTGPFLAADERRHVQRLASRDTRVRASGFRGDIGSLLARSDLVISMAGANTVAEVLAAGVPTILAPRSYPRREQLFRAERLEALGHARVLDTDRNDAAARLAELVRDALSGALRPAVRSLPDCGGADATAAMVARSFRPRAIARGASPSTTRRATASSDLEIKGHG